jgi:uncharacterized protein (DUF885 family)
MIVLMPTQCLQWLMQVVEASQSQQDVIDLEQGLWHWANRLLPQLESLYSGEWRQHGEVVQQMSEYCEICLELCDDLMENHALADESLVDEWRQKLGQAASAFRQAEAGLRQGRGLTSLVA